MELHVEGQDDRAAFFVYLIIEVFLRGFCGRFVDRLPTHLSTLDTRIIFIP